MINVNDRVEIINGSNYGYTQEGATGTVLKMDGSFRIYVEWDFKTLSNKGCLNPERRYKWTVWTKDVAIVGKRERYKDAIL